LELRKNYSYKYDGGKKSIQIQKICSTLWRGNKTAEAQTGQRVLSKKETPYRLLGNGADIKIPGVNEVGQVTKK